MKTLVVLALCATFAVLATALVFQPTYDSTTNLQNPLTGFAMYLARQATAADLDKEIFVPELNKNVMIRDYATTAYIRPSWRGLNSADNVYTWRDPNSNFAKLVQGAKDRGIRLAFRFVIDGRDQGQNTPQFVIDAGAAHWISNPNAPTQTTPFPQDPIVQQYYSKFITEFAKDFNDPAQVAFIDAYSFGKWGEAHDVRYKDPASTTPIDIEQVKEDSMNWVFDLYSSKFTKIPLLINYHRLVGHPSSWGSPNANSAARLNDAIAKGYSLRHDAFGMTGYYQSWEKNYVASKNFQRPVILEGGWITDGSSHRYWIDPSGDYREGYPEDVRVGEMAEAENAHVNMMDFRRQEVQTWFGKTFPLVQKFISEGGYRVYPTSVTLPEVAVLKKPFTITHTWVNKGWGYLPNNIPQWNFKYKVAFGIFTAAGTRRQLFLDTDAEPSDWRQNVPQTYNWSVPWGVTLPPPGDYIWAVAIVDSTTSTRREAEIEIAVTGERNQYGWVKLFNMKVVECAVTADCASGKTCTANQCV